MGSQSDGFPVVGVGASAGGVVALEGLFKGLQADCGMAFVIVTHLSPDRESLLHEVIGRYTELTVEVAQDGGMIEPSHIYVMPQNAVLTVEAGRLKIKRPNPVHRERKPIDIFFSSLAKDQGEYAVGIVLSGGDSDGTLGIKAIKERGGLTLAQASDGSGPRNPDMPKSAISTGLVDLALPAEEMGARLVDFARSFDVVDGLVQEEENGVLLLRQAREAIYALLRAESGHDFSGYKAKTFLRRVHRRMQVAQVSDIETYVEYLKRDPKEASQLFRDLLINVTNFFRDKEAFQALEKFAVPRLLEGKTANDTIRIWVPGCATGEEVYSIAIILREKMETAKTAPRVQIFATDIDEEALAVARTGRYPATLLDGVSPERLANYFHGDGTSYTVGKDVRELCIFSPHSVIKDPPFSRMDMVSCRNLLIYFGPKVQNQVIPTFHYALKPGGYLFLGTSEGVSQHADLFTTLDKKHRIFQAREHATSIQRLPMTVGGLDRDIRPHSLQHKSGRDFPLRQVVETHVLDRFAPAHVVVTGEGDIVYYSARTGRYLEPAQGSPSGQLLAMARKGLRLELRAALREAVQSRRLVMHSNIPVEDDEGVVQMTSLNVEPLDERRDGEPLYLVLFSPLVPVQQRPRDQGETDSDRDSLITDLEQELRGTRERLQSTIEEYETALEELKSSNEELVSVNEEAQSSNEELEASKEEMQSLNEELNTINAELAGKVEELDRANSDLRNLFESTQIATVFLDKNLVIRNFTPAASRFFNLRSGDVGRPLTDLASHLDYPGIKEHIHSVFETGELIEHRIEDEGRETHYLVRLIPYRDSESEIEGVVVTFVDISTLADAERHQKTLIAELNHRVKNMLTVVIALAQQTAKRAGGVEDFSNSLVRRLHAMARTYGVLSRENWRDASIRELIVEELVPFDMKRVAAEGPDHRLTPQQGLSLGMVVHELATNAIKYGALSVPEGQLDVTWGLPDDGGTLRLEWRERGGSPPVDKPKAKGGFGLKLVKGEIEYRLRGSVESRFDKSGVCVVIEFPLQVEAEKSDG